MSIQLVTYANQTVTPTNDAIIYERAIDQNGIFYGCNVTVSGNEVHITGGYGMVCGREFTIESEAIAVTLAPSGTLDGRLYVRLDLADADAPIQLLTATGNTLPPLEQDSDVNYTNGAYEMELATFTVGVSALSDVVETFDVISGMNDLLTKAISALGSEEELATGAYLIRFAKLRVLNLYAFKGANSTLTIPEADRPSHSIAVPMFRTNTSDTATAVGYVAISSSNGYVQRYYGGTYNGANGISNIGSTDKVYAVAVWIVGN